MAGRSVSYKHEEQLPPSNKGQAAIRDINTKRRAKTQANKEIYIQELLKDPKAPFKEIIVRVGFKEPTVRKWLQDDPEFAARCRSIKAKFGVPIPGRKTNHELQQVELTNFVEKRLYYFGYDTPWFQQKTVEAYEKAQPGDIVLVLMPPEHGKTTLTEDDLTLDIADHPDTLITCVSEGIHMARKISNRVRRRLEAQGPAPQLVLDKGPFEPQHGEGAMSQPWGADYWTVFGAEVHDQRDYTMAIGGWSSAIAGTRAKRLHLDDIMSLRNVAQAAKVFEKVRQDFLTRPGETGWTTINGTRVDEGDFYELMDNEFAGEDFYQKVEFPAIVLDQHTQEPKPLWERDEETGAGYTMEMLERLRKKVGEDAWWRNYMQEPKSQTLIVFSDDGVQKSRNHLRSYHHSYDDVRSTVNNNEAWITLDPSIGGINCVAAVHPGEKMVLLDLQEDTDLPRNSAIADRVRLVAQRLSSRGWRPTMLIIEAMAFQKGLVEDEYIKDVASEFGMRIESHLTGMNKYDEGIGIPSMASSVENGKLDLAYADDYSRHISDMLTSQLRAWKPYRDPTTGALKFKRGNQLRQDRLMALWFAWVWWTSYQGVLPQEQSAQSFQRDGLAWTPTRTGLLTPVRG